MAGGRPRGIDRPCTLAIWHQPRFSSGEHGNDTGVAPFWEALYAAGADVVVNGHDHDYERFAPQDPSGREDRERGIREFVVGTGGAELRDFDDVRRNSELRAAVTAGVLKLVLRADSYEWTFIPTQPSFSDSGSGALPLGDRPAPASDQSDDGLAQGPLEGRRARVREQAIEVFAGVRHEVDVERADALLEYAPHRLAEVGHDAHQA